MNGEKDLKQAYDEEGIWSSQLILLLWGFRNLPNASGIWNMQNLRDCR